MYLRMTVNSQVYIHDEFKRKLIQRLLAVIQFMVFYMGVKFGLLLNGKYIN